jgi:hypothetical protein
VWEIKVVTCGSAGTDCLLQLSRPGLPTIPLPSPGALTAGAAWHFTWQAAFAGGTQGSIAYACSVTPTGDLPWTGDGMALRHANFGGGLTEIFTGTCHVGLCSSFAAAQAVPNKTDKATEP